MAKKKDKPLWKKLLVLGGIGLAGYGIYSWSKTRAKKEVKKATADVSTGKKVAAKGLGHAVKKAFGKDEE